MGPHRDLVRGWLKAEIVDKVPVKQRHTARRVWQRLTEEQGAQVSGSTVRLFVAEVRAELAQVAGEVSVVQEHAPGAEAEIDFGEFIARIGGEQVKLWMFIMRLSASGRSFVVAFAHQAQEAFFEGHVLAFAAFGGVPTGQIRYDKPQARRDPDLVFPPLCGAPHSPGYDELRTMPSSWPEVGQTALGEPLSSSSGWRCCA
jgi:hypothetical protein